MLVRQTFNSKVVIILLHHLVRQSECIYWIKNITPPLRLLTLLCSPQPAIVLHYNQYNPKTNQVQFSHLTMKVHSIVTHYRQSRVVKSYRIAST